MTTTPPLTITALDPAGLTAHPRNVRTDLGDLTGLTASIAAQGVIEPLTVVPLPDGGHLLVAGHRRAAAAIAAGLDEVPCVVRADLAAAADAASTSDVAEHIGAMLAENLHREGLTAMEEARGVQAMLDLGISIEKVSKGTGLDRKRVALAAGVARLGESAAAAVVDAELTLDQAAVVARFEDDEDVVAELVEAAAEGPGEFAHAVTRAEQDRATAERLAKTRADLEAAGRTVLADDRHATRLSQLLQDGEALHAENHADCPGSAVVIEAYHWKPDVAMVEVCTDPAGNGHTSRWGASTTSLPGKPATEEDEQAAREAAAAERRAVIESNKAMDAANITRRAWVRDFLARPKASKEVLRFAVESLATSRSALADWFGGGGSQEGEEAVKSLHLLKPMYTRGEGVRTLTNGDNVPDARLPLQLLAHIAGAMEATITRDAWRWQDRRREDAGRWLTFLVGQGYTLSEVEQSVVDGAAS